MSRLLQAVTDLACWPGRVIGWLMLPLILFVCLGVVAAQVGLNRLVDWQTSVPLLGTGITSNTLLDLQWSAFALIALFGGVLAFRDRSHVNVDFLSNRLSPRTRMLIDLAGDILFLLPFCAVVVWYGSRFALASYNSGEASTYGGLRDYWIVKACIPLSFLLLGLAGVARILTTLGALRSRPDQTGDRA
ncbi:TRAP transporter small permease subunit [Microvirga tunisiensis]|uniref:TRAP transporter small permease protein n=2 Tax=Pannonibacter tanglangensis TaxID=2750084 RepID=A0A7X5JAY9_9HYPH|nr:MULTISPECIES: TRAP transporter small permease subunit [unclassified Pannonibacter]NBN65132.1 TRAP transporter small permease subunit [Pannonibacter sp. XCT-34]NBN79890.1 TRAP transporter small permease subunit [Pannonibacter sp. XCT-53]